MHERARSGCRIVSILISPGLSVAHETSSYLHPEDAQPANSAPATCEAAYRYLYCVPGTYTYIFFNTIKRSLQPPTSYATALNSSIKYIQTHIATDGDGTIAFGILYLATPTTNVQIHGEDGGGHHLTWGVFGAALQGLNAWMGDQIDGYTDATFQINDGKNEVGNGYIGALNQEQRCVFANAFQPNTTCAAVDSAGLVYGDPDAKAC